MDNTIVVNNKKQIVEELILILDKFENMDKNLGFLRVMTLIFSLQVLFTYIGGNILRTTYLTPLEWAYIFGFSLLIIPVDLIRKIVFTSNSKVFAD